MKCIKVLTTLILICLCSSLYAKQFTVVIDPGHGGKDPGATGKIGQEKTINLNVALMVGKMITEQYPDVNVVYTRKTDKYVTLQERPQIANNADGDLFISIHTNAAEASAASGVETFTLGLSKSNANFEVAKRENSVLLLEDGNKETYQGFDPTSPDSYIMFEFMQSKYIDQSVEMAYYVQKEFVKEKRLDRGVRQAIFWVLHQVKMPSILVELGFITNPSEEKFLVSHDGQQKLAKSIVSAFCTYKHEYDKRTIIASQTIDPQSVETNNSPKAETKNKVAQTDLAKNKKTNNNTAPKETDAKTENTPKPSTTKVQNTETKPTQTNTDKTVFKVQVFSAKHVLSDNHDDIRKLRNLKPITHIVENGWYKYYCTETTDYEQAQKNLREARKLFGDAFLVAFRNGKKISLTEALKNNM